MLANTFWENFLLLLIFLPLAILWGCTLLDVFRRDDIGGISKALWVVCVVLLPFLGTLIYLIARRPGATRDERAMIGEQAGEFASRYSASSDAAELHVLAELHDRGKLSDSEFEAEKARVLGAAASTPTYRDGRERSGQDGE